MDRSQIAFGRLTRDFYGCSCEITFFPNVKTSDNSGLHPISRIATNPPNFGEEGKRQFFTRKVQPNACLPPLALGLIQK